MTAPAEAMKLNTPKAFACSSGFGKSVTIMAGDQHRLAERQPAQKRSADEHAEAYEVDALAPEQVAQPARE